MAILAMRRLAIVLVMAAHGVVRARRVAVVTGASRGIGRGIALELGAAGFSVYALGRSSRSEGMTSDRPVAAGADLTVESAAEEICAAGGVGHAIVCDVASDTAVSEAIASVAEKEGRLDALVCSAYATPPGRLRDDFWKQGMEMWDACNGVGLRGVYSTCLHAVPRMIATAEDPVLAAPPPLVVLVSSFGGKAYTFNVAYGVGKAAVDRLASDMSYQLKKHNVAAVTLYPGVVATEANLEMEVRGEWAEASGGLDLSVGETPRLSGKAVAALLKLEPDALLERSGSVQVVAELAEELGFTDENGATPPSIRSLGYLLPNFVFPDIEKRTGKPLPAWVRDNVPTKTLLPWSIFSAGPPPEPEP